MIEVHHICLNENAQQIFRDAAKRYNTTVDDLLEKIIEEAVDELEKKIRSVQR